MIHGGAGATTRGQTPPEAGAALRAARGLALDAGSAILKRGRIVLDPVEPAVRVLEEDPPCNGTRPPASRPSRSTTMSAE